LCCRVICIGGIRDPAAQCYVQKHAERVVARGLIDLPGAHARARKRSDIAVRAGNFSCIFNNIRLEFFGARRSGEVSKAPVHVV